MPENPGPTLRRSSVACLSGGDCGAGGGREGPPGAKLGSKRCGICWRWRVLPRAFWDVEVKSVKNKWKNKAFAAPVNRAGIEHAAEQLGVPLAEHIALVLAALQKDADLVGLR